jgi:hypothetical protein
MVDEFPQWKQRMAAMSGHSLWSSGRGPEDRGRNQNAEGRSVVVLLQKTSRSGESMAGPAAYLDGSRGSSRE